MNINVAVCDDENKICDEIKRLLLHIRPDYNITIYNSGYELLESEVTYDLIFLDIEMPDIDGMKTAEVLRDKNNDEYIIFLTNHTEMMPHAFKVKAFRFLNKPIKSEEFVEAVVEVEKEILNNGKILIGMNGETKFIRIKDIVYFEAFGDGTYIHMKNEVLESNKPLRYWNEQMGTVHFFQVHKSYTIALRYIGKMEAKAVTLSYKNEVIPISRRRYKELKETAIKYVREQSHYM